MESKLINSKNFKLEDLIKRNSSAYWTFEYNCHLHRLFPWDGVADTKKPTTELGLIWVKVDPKTSIEGHSHDEEEAFVIVSGVADLILEGQRTKLKQGDTAYIPRNWHHTMKNNSTEDLVYLDMFWGLNQKIAEK